MNSKSLLLPVLVVITLLSGCFGNDADTQSSSQCDARYQAASGDANVTYRGFRDAWEAEYGNWTDSDDDCFNDEVELALGTDPLDPQSFPTSPIMDSGVTTTVIAGNTGISVATPLRTFNNGGAFNHPIELSEDHNGFVLEMVWTPNGQGNTDQLDLWVRDAASGTIPPEDASDVYAPAQPIAQVSGSSPLRLVLTPDIMEVGKEYSMLIRAASPAGVAYEQEVQLYVHEFIGAELDPEFSVL